MAGPRLVPRPFASASSSSGRSSRRQQPDDAMSRTERSSTTTRTPAVAHQPCSDSNGRGLVNAAYLHYPFPRSKKAPVADYSDQQQPPKPTGSSLGSKLLSRPTNRVAANRASASVSDSSISRSSGSSSSTLAQLSRFNPARGGNQVASSNSLRSQCNDSSQSVDEVSDSLATGLSVAGCSNNNSSGSISTHAHSSLPTIGELPRLNGQAASSTVNIVSSSALSSSGASSSFQQRLYSTSRTSPLSSSASSSSSSMLPGNDAAVKKSNPKGLVGLQNLGNTWCVGAAFSCFLVQLFSSKSCACPAS
jgi:hypothetical protein